MRFPWGGGGHIGFYVDTYTGTPLCYDVNINLWFCVQVPGRNGQEPAGAGQQGEEGCEGVAGGNQQKGDPHFPACLACVRNFRVFPKCPRYESAH